MMMKLLFNNQLIHNLSKLKNPQRSIESKKVLNDILINKNHKLKPSIYWDLHNLAFKDNVDNQFIKYTLFYISKSDNQNLDFKLNFIRNNFLSIKSELPSIPINIHHEFNNLEINLSLIKWLLTLNDQPSLDLAYNLFKNLNSNNDISLTYKSISIYCHLIAINFGKGRLSIDFLNLLLKQNLSDDTLKLSLIDNLINKFTFDGNQQSMRYLIDYLIKNDFTGFNFDKLFQQLVELNDNVYLLKLYLYSINKYKLEDEKALLQLSNYLTEGNQTSKHKAFILNLFEKDQLSSLSSKVNSKILINLTKLNQLDLITLLFNHLIDKKKFNFLKDSKMISSIVRVFTKSQSVENINFANLVFDYHLNNTKPSDFNHVQLTTLARICLHLNNPTAALEIFRHMLSRNILPDIKDINVVLLLASQDSPKVALNLLNHAILRGLNPSSETYGTLLNAAFQSNDYQLIDNLLVDLESRKIDILPFTQVIVRYFSKIGKNFNHLLLNLDKSDKYRPSKSLLFDLIDDSLEKKVHPHQTSFLLNLMAKYNYLTSSKRHSILLKLIHQYNLFDKFNHHYHRSLLSLIDDQSKFKIPDENSHNMITFIATFSYLNDKVKLFNIFNRLNNLPLSINNIIEILDDMKITVPKSALNVLASNLEQFNRNNN
ncbi:hypothetical protein E3Q09_01345 [Wallemia mellicola]|nr:hypothetical protein E3Q21_01308 [Wallemia mellicola]TIC36472.1 hypothetical protein E3Q09_01345 [Wallemia mellicola]TIC42138.1 hypothetical protein E3Q07_01231 [Wallemia mellicola]